MAKNEVQRDHKNNEPIAESSITTSEDGEWVIFKTTFTTIKPVRYMEKVLGFESPGEESPGTRWALKENPRKRRAEDLAKIAYLNRIP